MKRRLIAGSLALLFFLWLSLICAGNFGLLLAGQYSRCSLFPVAELARDPRGGRLFFILALCSILLVFWMLFGRSYLNYKSKMYEVVPGFYIPYPEGQGQHGTAWFMPASKFPQTFACAATDGSTLDLPPELTERYKQERSEILNAGSDRSA